jgi:hypothetical protein
MNMCEFFLKLNSLNEDECSSKCKNFDRNLSKVKTDHAINMHNLMLEINRSNYNDKLIRCYTEGINQIKIKSLNKSKKSTIIDPNSIFSIKHNYLTEPHTPEISLFDSNESRILHINKYLNKSQDFSLDKRMGQRDYKKHEMLINEIRFSLRQRPIRTSLSKNIFSLNSTQLSQQSLSQN